MDGSERCFQDLFDLHLLGRELPQPLWLPLRLLLPPAADAAHRLWKGRGTAVSNGEARVVEPWLAKKESSANTLSIPMVIKCN